MSTKDIFPTWRGDLEWRNRAADLRKAWPEDPGYAALDRRIETEPGRLYHLSPGVLTLFDAVPEERRQAHLYGFLLWQMGRFDGRFAARPWPPEIALHYGDCFHRMMDDIEAGSLAADPRSDLYEKDLALTRLELIPAVAQLLHPGGGIPLRHLLGWPAGWAYVLGRCGGRQPFYEAHTHDPMVKTYFNYEGWEETYRITALLMRHDPSQRGLVGFSWMVDPQLGALSPRLAYMHDRPDIQGARFMPMDCDADSARLATALSPTRREAWRAGTYKPRRHGLIWSRPDMLKHYG